MPPTVNGCYCKLCGVMIKANTYPAFIGSQIVDAIGDRFALVLIHKVVHTNPFWFAFGLLLPDFVRKITYQFLLFRIDRDHRLTTLLVILHLLVNVSKLSISVGVIFALFRLSLPL